jgi:F0F1-type ATP synthase assembly protein I
MNFALSIFVGLFMGWGVHKLFHLGNWVIMAGMILGIISSYVLLFQDLKALNTSADDKSHGPQS